MVFVTDGEWVPGEGGSEGVREQEIPGNSLQTHSKSAKFQEFLAVHVKRQSATRKYQNWIRNQVIPFNLVGLDPRDAQPLVSPREINDSEHVWIAWKPVFAHGFHGISPEITRFTKFPLAPTQNGLARPSFTGKPTGV